MLRHSAGVFLWLAAVALAGDDVVTACGYEQAAGVGVGAVDEDLVVDSVGGGWGTGDIDEPQRGEPAVERAPGDVQGVGDLG